MEKQIKKNVAIVTGSSRGIGMAIAKALCTDMSVVINGRSESQLLTARQKLAEEGFDVAAVCADVSLYDGSRYLYEESTKLGQVSVLINNAGVSHVGLFTDMTPDLWQNLCAINQYTVFNMTHAVLPEMIRNKSGCIVNISSIWGLSGASCEAIYSATKGAINSFTKAIAREVGPSGIRVNAIACGVIDTTMNDFLTDEELVAIKDNIPVSRIGTTDDIAATAAFLCRDEASYITGQVITVDGGML